MKDKVQLLINILLDKEGRDDERQDAAMYLGNHAVPKALDALITIASDPNEDDVLVDDCSQSIGEIFIALNHFDENSFNALIPFAQRMTFFRIMGTNPELINEPLRTELTKKFEIEKQQNK